MFTIVIVAFLCLPSLSVGYLHTQKLFPIAKRLSTKSETVLTMSALHSAFFNETKNSIKEKDDAFSVEELEELKELINTSLTRKKTAVSDSNILQDLGLITKEACDAVTPMLKG